MDTVKIFSEIHLNDLPLVGGKNASLGEMFCELTSKGIAVPDGFAVTARGYWDFLNHNKLIPDINTLISQLDRKSFTNLSETGEKIRRLIIEASFPESLKKDILVAASDLYKRSGNQISLAVRSSATAEDLPDASFAGQQETYLNVKGDENLIKACHRCYASLFTDRAIKYREDHGYDHIKVALSIGAQVMVRSDKACSGVMFTIDPDSGFENVVLVSGAWGLGENVVQGSVNTDEFLVFKPLLGKVNQSVISHKLGSKMKTMIYSGKSLEEIRKPEDAVLNLETPAEKRKQFILEDKDIVQLADWAIKIQNHYKLKTLKTDKL